MADPPEAPLHCTPARSSLGDVLRVFVDRQLGEAPAVGGRSTRLNARRVGLHQHRASARTDEVTVASMPLSPTLSMPT